MPLPAEPGIRYRLPGDPPQTVRRVPWLPGAALVRLPAGAGEPQALAGLSSSGRLDGVRLAAVVPDYGAAVLRVDGFVADDPSAVARYERLLDDLRAAGLRPARVPSDPTQTYALVPTGEVVVRLVDRAQPPPAWLATDPRWTYVRALPYAPGAHVLAPAPDASPELARDIEAALLPRAELDTVYAVLVFQAVSDEQPPFPEQWHLGRTQLGPVVVDGGANVVRAWRRTRGAGACVAIVEPGAIDHRHVQFADPGKVVDASSFSPAGRVPMQIPLGPGKAHGTKMAGLAVASGHDVRPPGAARPLGASGVAPEASLVAVSVGHALGSLHEADGLVHAASAAFGTSVVSCSWGPEVVRGAPYRLQGHTRWALDWVLTRGGARGRGIPVLFAAGNFSPEEAAGAALLPDLNGYACHRGVISVGACNALGVRASYSGRGRRLTCVGPAGDPAVPVGHGHDLLTTDETDVNGSKAAASPAGDYTTPTGRTSAACAACAGLVALLLAAFPGLEPADVRQILMRTAVRIDRRGGGWRGARSLALGSGRVDAARALRRARTWIRGARRKRRARRSA